MAEPESLTTRQRFDGVGREAVEAIAQLLDVEAVREPYEPAPGEAVYAIRHRSETGTLRLVLWPSLARVDVSCGPHAWVAKAVRETEVIAGLEVIFRFGRAEGGAEDEGHGEPEGPPDGTLFVGVGGDVMMVAGEARPRGGGRVTDSDSSTGSA